MDAQIVTPQRRRFQVLRNAALLLKHISHQKLVVPLRRKSWIRRREPVVAKAARGLRFRLHPGQYLDECIYLHGIYDRPFLNVLRGRLGSGGVMLDVGANIGNHALYLSDLFDEIHCFEPSPHIADRLEENIRLNGLNNIHVHRVGLGSSEGLLPFVEVDSNLGLSHFAADGEGGRLPVTTGDKWVAGSGLTRVDFIKIDVEGFELEVLRGLAETIARFRPLVAFEYLNFSDEAFAEIRSILSGYEIYEPVVEPESSAPLAKVLFYLRAGTKPVFRRVSEGNRQFMNLLAEPSSR